MWNSQRNLRRIARHQDAASEQRKKVVAAGEKETRLEKAYQEVQEKIDEFKLSEKQRTVQSASLATKINSLQSPINQQPNQALKSTVEDLVEDIQEKEKEVSRLAVEVRRLEEKEQAAAKNQFIRETSAAKADPDTYVAGKVSSVDPVTRVSISVIGEGVIYLRGPRNGVTRIRQMINQIDHPVGQVKIGVMTLQLNGENGNRMEDTLRRVDGHVSRGRFLTYVSEQLFLRAVQEVATRAAAGLSRNPREEPASFARSAMIHLERHQRWLRYIQEFFGGDFLKALLDVNPDSPVLDPLNKLVSISSSDTLTIAEALFIAGLAKAEYRHQIVDRFDYYLHRELPKKDARWVEINRIRKGWDPRWWGDELCSSKKVIKHGQQTYRFEAIRTLFERDFSGLSEGDSDTPLAVNDRLNPLQREFIKMVQGITIEHALHVARDRTLTKWTTAKQGILLAAERQGIKNAEAKLLADPDIRKLKTYLDLLTEKHAESQEVLRGRKAALDKLIKQAIVALEDDVYAQFYNPAMEKMRRSAGDWDIELSQIERATILTNNRAFGKVAPQATFEFDLPKRDILVAEAMKSAYALHKDIGPLLGDPQFATLAKLYSGQSITGASVDSSIKNLLPGLPSETDQQALLYADSVARPRFGTELEKLIPAPAIYKFETGTGFEVRPVVQPDGQSVVFDFNYMYTTDLLESTNPDERQLGRVKRHFINTEVQLGNLEWREISRYEVALKAARNSRGVPLLEDIPLVGLAFRPLPQAKSAIQRNVIIGQAAIYPTVEDLLGLQPSSASGLLEFLNDPENIRKLKEDRQKDLDVTRDTLDWLQDAARKTSPLNKNGLLHELLQEAEPMHEDTPPAPAPGDSPAVEGIVVPAPAPASQAGFRKPPLGRRRQIAGSRTTNRVR